MESSFFALSESGEQRYECRRQTMIEQKNYRKAISVTKSGMSLKRSNLKGEWRLWKANQITNDQVDGIRGQRKKELDIR